MSTKGAPPVELNLNRGNPIVITTNYLRPSAITGFTEIDLDALFDRCFGASAGASSPGLVMNRRVENQCSSANCNCRHHNGKGFVKIIETGAPNLFPEVEKLVCPTVSISSPPKKRQKVSKKNKGKYGEDEMHKAMEDHEKDEMRKAMEDEMRKAEEGAVKSMAEEEVMKGMNWDFED
jgi:hypothetical protein